jgi:hypothetical protein
MANTCPNCEHSFNATTALCEDWKVPEKSYGCPECHTFFYRKLQDPYKVSKTNAIFIPSVLGMGLGGLIIYHNIPSIALMIIYGLSALVVFGMLFYRIIKFSRQVLIPVDDQASLRKAEEAETSTWHYQFSQLRQKHPVMGTLITFLVNFGMMEFCRNFYILVVGEEPFSFGLGIVIAASITAASIPPKDKGGL